MSAALLIARLEDATASGIIMESDAVALQSALGLEDEYDTDWKQCCWNALKGSLDSALALADQVLDDAGILRGPLNINICLAGSAQVVIDSNDPCDPVIAQCIAQTPALALCLALFSARPDATPTHEGDERG